MRGQDRGVAAGTRVGRRDGTRIEYPVVARGGHERGYVLAVVRECDAHPIRERLAWPAEEERQRLVAHKLRPVAPLVTHHLLEVVARLAEVVDERGQENHAPERLQ